MSRKIVRTVIGGALMVVALAGAVLPAWAQAHDRLRVPVGRAEVVTSNDDVRTVAIAQQDRPLAAKPLPERHHRAPPSRELVFAARFDSEHAVRPDARHQRRASDGAAGRSCGYSASPTRR